MDHLSLVETVDGFGESVVIGISDAADRRLDTSFSQALGVLIMDTYWADSNGRRNTSYFHS
jgi:hypothetical protein